jgi:hypothetical protein
MPAGYADARNLGRTSRTGRLRGDEEKIAALGAWTRERPDRAVVAQTMAALRRG